MPKKQRRKVVIAGQYLRSIQYSMHTDPDVHRTRQAKTRLSSIAREAMNLRYSRQKLKAVIAANFGIDDIVVTLTYSDEASPKNRGDAEKRLKAFIRRFRAERKAAGLTLPYIYVTEMGHSSGRIHHHFITSSTGDDYKQIRRLWLKNGSDVDISSIGEAGYDRWAEYLAKEPREYGRRYVGERMWRSSLGLNKPITYAGWVEKGARLDDLPDGTVFLGSRHDSNWYGSFDYVEAILPPSIDVSAIALISGLG